MLQRLKEYQARHAMAISWQVTYRFPFFQLTRHAIESLIHQFIREESSPPVEEFHQRLAQRFIFLPCARRVGVQAGQEFRKRLFSQSL
jgi:hypothetical protein